MTEMNLTPKLGADIYQVIAGGNKVEVVIMMELKGGLVLVEALKGNPFEQTSYFGSSCMVCQAVYHKQTLKYLRKWLG